MPPLRPFAAPRCLGQNTITNSLSLRARTFCTTPCQARQTPTHLKVPFEKVPDYPYGEFRWYKQRNVGLYGNSKIRFGNTIAPKYNRKSVTHWKPNRQMKRLWSPALGMFIRTRLTTGVLKTVDKLGGIDNYLLGTKARRVKDLGPAGWRLRWKLIQSPAIQEQWAAEREAMGLPPKMAAEEEAGAPSAEEMSEVDAMLAREDEFVLGDVEEGELFMAEEPQYAADEAREKSQEALEEMKR
jgi:large subunit ribosomal protein L28